MEQFRVASDVGGTFTDLVYCPVDVESGDCGPLQSLKTSTTPPDFETGVMTAMHKAGLSPAGLSYFAHGSTVVINALTERKGVRTALITTRGFRDVLEIARGNRPDLFNFHFKKPKPFVERCLRAELSERTLFTGKIQRAVDLSHLPELIEFFKSEQVESIAVCFLHSYANPANEKRTAARIKQLWPEVAVLASHEVSREWREYERTSTTVLSAYVHPIARRYIESLHGKLTAGGFSGEPYFMQSNGGIVTARAAGNNPITMVESGPASGIFAAACLGKAIGSNNLIALDIGGTTAKCALIEEGEIHVTTEYYIERDRKNPGYPLQAPVYELVEIGNGGGSIAWVDEGGMLHVGPQSSGALPGPAAYGRGGDRPTTTDANLLLGRIDPSGFAGGRAAPDWDAINAAFKPLQDKLSMSREELARGIVRMANANMANALRLVSVNQGHDPRDFTLIAFGGGGAMHGVALAEELKVSRLIVPANSAVFSAWGMLLTDLRRDYLQTCPVVVDAANADTLADTLAALMQRAATDYEDDGVDSERDIRFDYYADMRYSGQEHTVRVGLPVTAGRVDTDAALEGFHAAHEKRFTYRLEAGVQIVSLHLVATVDVAKPDIAKRSVRGRCIQGAVLSERRVDFDRHGVHDAMIYDGIMLEPEMELSGPAIIQEPSVSMVVPPGCTVRVDEFGNYHLSIGDDA